MRASRASRVQLLCKVEVFIILAIIGTEKLIATENSDKVNGACNVGQGYQVNVYACRACQWQLLVMQCFIILAIIATEKHSLVFYVTT